MWILTFDGTQSWRDLFLLPVYDTVILCFNSLVLGWVQVSVGVARHEPGWSFDLSTGGRSSAGKWRLYSPHIQRDSSAFSSQFGPGLGLMAVLGWLGWLGAGDWLGAFGGFGGGA